MTETEHGRAIAERDPDAVPARDATTHADPGDGPAGDPRRDERVFGDAETHTGPRARRTHEVTPEAHDAYYVTDPGDTEVH